MCVRKRDSQTMKLGGAEDCLIKGPGVDAERSSWKVFVKVV
jgi:hypothetical protein